MNAFHTYLVAAADTIVPIHLVEAGKQLVSWLFANVFQKPSASASEEIGQNLQMRRFSAPMDWVGFEGNLEFLTGSESGVHFIAVVM